MNKEFVNINNHYFNLDDIVSLKVNNDTLTIGHQKYHDHTSIKYDDNTQAIASYNKLKYLFTEVPGYVWCVNLKYIRCIKFDTTKNMIMVTTHSGTIIEYISYSQNDMTDFVKKLNIINP